MQITEIRVFPRHDGALRAFVSITFDDCFCVKGIRIIETDGRWLVAMPSRQLARGDWKDIAHPINQEFRQYLDGRILAAYEMEIESMARKKAFEKEPPLSFKKERIA